MTIPGEEVVAREENGQGAGAIGESASGEKVGADLEMDAGVHQEITDSEVASEEVTMNTLWPQIFHGQVQLMKDMLKRGEMIYGGDRENPGYKVFKQDTMRSHYEAIDAFWALLQRHELVEKCECEGEEQQGMARRWTACKLCGGSGFKAMGTAAAEEPVSVEKEVPSGTAEDSPG